MTKRKRQRRVFIKKSAKWLGLSLAGGFLFILALFAYFAKDLPTPQNMGQRQVVESTKIFDRTGRVILYDIHNEEKRTVVLFNEIPQFIKDATVVIEDDNFYHHLGIDWQGILRAAWANLRGKKISQGGSTITQQFIKNAYLGGPQAARTFPRKIKEAILSIELEMKYSKDEILAMYLNQVPYGSNAYGIEAASQTFFNKSAKDLTLAQGILLVSLPKAPSYYSPYGSHPDELKARQEYILDRMNKFGYLTSEQIQQAEQEELPYASQTDLKAHHFVTMVKEYLEEKYGQDYGDINTAGLKIYTTMDWSLQRIAEEAVDQGVAKNEKKYRVSNAALVALDPKTGQVLALVGSRSYEQDQYNVATSPNRQPGSSFKPFIYAMALKKGLRPETIVFDLQTNFGKFGPGQGQDYIPRNYDGKFRGPVTLKSALAQSLNIPSVKVFHLAGTNDSINLAQDMGITTLKDRERYGLSLVLGGGEIKLIDEVAAYSVFASEGTKHPINFILKIEDAQGKTLEEYQDKPVRVLEEQICRQISDILSDDNARSPIFGFHSSLYLPGRPAAAKTGTTQDYSDGWTVGYTPSLVAGVWVGNNDYAKKMTSAGAETAAPLWKDFMLRAYEQKLANSSQPAVPNDFSLPEQVEQFTLPAPSPSSTIPMANGELAFQNKVKIDKISGKLATDLTPPDLTEEKTYQEVHSILYYLDKNDPQFANWEQAVVEWVSSQDCPKDICYNQNPPSQFDDIHTIENQPIVQIISPQTNQLITGSTLTIQVQASAKLGIKQVDFFLNDQLVGTDSAAPYSINFNLGRYLNPSVEQTIKARAYDQTLNRQEDEIVIKTAY